MFQFPALVSRVVGGWWVGLVSGWGVGLVG